MKLTALLPGLLTLATCAMAADVVTLPNTAPLTWTGDLSAKMHEAALHDMDQRIADSITERAKRWHRDTSSPEAYAQSVAGNRGRFLYAIGMAEPAGRGEMERFGDEERPALVAETSRYRVWQVRWRALEGVHGEGLLLEPRDKPRAYVIAVPDADQTPEQITGLAPGVPAESQFARRLAENGFAVVVPVLIDRSDAGSGNSAITMTNQPHREWIYRQAYMMGRHIIGYEVQKVLAASDWASSKGVPVGVVGAVVEHRVVGHPVTVEVGQRIVTQTVPVEVQTNRVQHAVSVGVDVRWARPHRGGAVAGTEAIVHTLIRRLHPPEGSTRPKSLAEHRSWLDPKPGQPR